MDSVVAGIGSRVQWGALVLSLLTGVLNTGAFLSYVMAYHKGGSPALEVAYALRLVWQPWLVIGFLLSLSAIIIRMWVFAEIGGQRTWFVSSFGVLVNTAMVAMVLKDTMAPVQWLGGGLIMVGSVLAATRSE